MDVVHLSVDATYYVLRNVILLAMIVGPSGVDTLILDPSLQSDSEYNAAVELIFPTEYDLSDPTAIYGGLKIAAGQYQQSGSFVEHCCNKSSTLRAEGKQWSFKASTRSSS